MGIWTAPVAAGVVLVAWWAAAWLARHCERRRQIDPAWARAFAKHGKVKQRFSGFDPDIRARTAAKRKEADKLSLEAAKVTSRSVDVEVGKRLKVVRRGSGA
jgi:hypothetical protein